MEKNHFAFRAAALWLVCVVLAGAPVPELTDFAVQDLFLAAALPLLLMSVGYGFEKERTRHGCGMLLLTYVLIRGAACVIVLAFQPNARQDLIPWIQSTILAGRDVGEAWLLPCLAAALVLLHGVLRIPQKWLRLTLVLACGAGAIVLDLPDLPAALDVAPVFLFFLYAGWAARQYGLLSVSPKWLAAAGLIWCAAGFDGALDLGARAWPHSAAALAPALCGGFLGLGAVKKWKYPRGGNAAALFAAWCLAETLTGMFFATRDPWAVLSAKLLITALAYCVCGLLPRMAVLLRRCWQTVFLALMAALVVKLYTDATAIGLKWPAWYENGIRLGLLTLALGRLYGKASQGKGRQLILPCLIGAAFLGSFLRFGYLFLLDMVLLIFCAMDVPWKRLLRVHFTAVMATFGVVFTASILGICPNEAAFRGAGWRYYFGSGGPTDFAAHMAFLALTWWAMKDRVPTLGLIAVMLTSVVFQAALTDTRCSELVLLAACAGAAYVALTDRFREKPLVKGLNKTVDVLGQVMMPLCAAIIIGLSLRFDGGSASWQKLNDLLSARLSLTHDAFAQYGFTLFGMDYMPIGIGLSPAASVGYNFVDSSYCLILVRYGIVPLLAVLFLWGLTQKKAAAQGNRKLEIAMILVAVASVMEHHLTDIFYNPFILLPFADFGEPAEARDAEPLKPRLVRGCTALAVTVLFALCLPRLILYGQTAAAIAKKWESYNQWLACGALLLALAALWKLWQYLTQAVSSRILDGAFPKRTAAKLVSVLAVLILMGLGAAGTVNRGAAAYAERLRDGKTVLSLLEENGLDCRVLVDEVPMLFQREMDGIDRRILPVSTATGLENGVVLTDRRLDCYYLAEAGFTYVPISEDSALYTNSPAALEMLAGRGYPGYPFCNAENVLDMGAMARRNKLPLTARGTILLDGQTNPMNKGPYIHLYYGTYRIQFRLKVLYAPDAEGALGRAEVSSGWGTADMHRVPFTREDVDEWGRVNVSLDVYFDNRDQIEFSVFPYGDTLLEVESVTYQRIS